MPGPLPTKLANFEIEGPLGAGGMAEVFLAKKRGAEGTYKRLVVKRILETHGSSPRFHAMFAEEAQLATRLNHPNIVQVYDFQDYGAEGHLLSMEYVEGPDLRKLMRGAKAKGKRISPYVAAHIVGEVARGLHYAHERRDEDGSPLEIVHRDVSPQNILLSYDGAVKVADFGIATANLFRQETGVLKGKTAYMSPEQARAEKVDRRSDIYSLGVVFHELLTGRPLHGSLEGKELLEAVRAGVVEPPNLFATGIPGALADIAMRAIEHDRELRFSSARELSSAITHVLFELHQLVDAETLEQTIAEFIERTPLTPQLGTRERDDSRSNDSRATADSSNSHDQAQPRPTTQRAGREVRHVALVGLRIHGREEMERVLGKAQTSRLADQLRATFDDIAFKQGTRWQWEDVESRDGATAITLGSALAIVGAGANPSRAASDAAWLTVFTHEAISGACDALPVALSASLSIVRGVAEGRRDTNGNLVNYSIQDPAEALTRRLCLEAAASATWVAGGIFRLLRRDFLWTEEPGIDLSSLALPQLPPSMRVHGLERPLSRAEKRAHLAAAPRALVGRDAELADLHAAYHQCVTGNDEDSQGQIVVRIVVGELGIGKTALVSTLFSELPPHARELRAECSPYRSEVPFTNAAIWLRELLGVRSEDSNDQVLSAIVEALGPAPAELSDDTAARLTDLAQGQLSEATEEGEALRQRRIIFAGLRVIFARATRIAPLVVMVDCLQWIDSRSLEFLTSLAQRQEPQPLLLLLVTRPQERVLAALEGVVRLELGGLPAENQQRLIETHLEVASGVREACSDLIPRAGGNPFFLLEMVDSLLERGALEVHRDASTGKASLLRNAKLSATDALPSTLEQLIADRLNELQLQERSVIEWLAIAASPLTRTDLAELTQFSSEQLAESLRALSTRGIADCQRDTVDVKHPLIRDVCYRALAQTERQVMHRRVGSYLASTHRAVGMGAATVAKHFQTGGDDNSAFTYYLKAAQHAHTNNQLALASNYYQRALEVVASGDIRRLDVALRLEEIARVLCRPLERKQYLQLVMDEARRSNRTEHAAIAVLRQGQFELERGNFGQALKLCRIAERATHENSARELQSQVKAGLSSALLESGEASAAIAAASGAVTLAQDTRVSPKYLADSLVARGNGYVRVGRASEAMVDYAESIALFRLLGSRRNEARTKTLLSQAALVYGRYEDALALAIESIRIDISFGGRFPVARSLACIGRAYQALGDFKQAERHYQKALEAHTRGEEQDCRVDTLLAAASLHLANAPSPETEVSIAARLPTELLDQAAALRAPEERSYNATHALLLHARLSLLNRDATQALLFAGRARKLAEERGYLGLLYMTQALEAQACALCGESRLALLLALECVKHVEGARASEYALDAYILCVTTLGRLNAPEAQQRLAQARSRVLDVAKTIRDAELRNAFLRMRLGALELEQAGNSDSACAQ